MTSRALGRHDQTEHTEARPGFNCTPKDTGHWTETLSRHTKAFVLKLQPFIGYHPLMIHPAKDSHELGIPSLQPFNSSLNHQSKDWSSCPLSSSSNQLRLAESSRRSHSPQPHPAEARLRLRSLPSARRAHQRGCRRLLRVHWLRRFGQISF